MIATVTYMVALTRAVFLGATRPQTPRLQSPPPEADAGSVPPCHSFHLRLRVVPGKDSRIDGINEEAGQGNRERYSSQPGGSLFDAHLAQSSIAVSSCSMADQIAQCADAAVANAVFVCCVAHLTNDWRSDALISGADKGSIQSCAAQADER